jgi:opacity protein-like surface antigen
MVMKEILVAFVVLAGIALPAFADNSGTYYGAFDIQANTWGYPSPSLKFKDPNSYRLTAGYNFTPVWAAELAYTMIDDSKCSSCTTTIKTSSIQLAAVGNYALNETIGFFGKLGLAINSASVNAALGTDETRGNNSLLFGVGIRYMINKQVDLRLQYESLGKFITAPTGNFSLTAVSVGAIYKF